jgi:hypothetical protein
LVDVLFFQTHIIWRGGNLYLANGGDKDEAKLLIDKFGIDVQAIFYSIKCLLEPVQKALNSI